MDDNEIIGSIGGRPLTRGQLKARLKESGADYKAGRYYTHAEVKAFFKKKFAAAKKNG